MRLPTAQVLALPSVALIGLVAGLGMSAQASDGDQSESSERAARKVAIATGGVSPKGSRGLAAADINYVSARKYTWWGWAEDQCPQDGYGTSFKFEHAMASGGITASEIKVQDIDGCGNGPTYGSDTVERTNRIAATRIRLCFTNDANPCFFESLESGWYSNPL